MSKRQQQLQRWHITVSPQASSGDSNVTGSSLSEVAALDKLIDLLKGANGQQELTKLVAENLLAFDQKFWIRLATRSDAAQSSTEKEGLTNLANVRYLTCWQAASLAALVPLIGMVQPI